MSDRCDTDPPMTNLVRPARRHGVWISGLAAFAAAAAAAAQAQSPVNTCDSVPIENLKAAYLACDRRMSTQRVDTTLAQRCGAIGTALQRHGFGGDFDRLIEWWRRERGASAVALPAASLPSCESDASSPGN